MAVINGCNERILTIVIESNDCGGGFAFEVKGLNSSITANAHNGIASYGEEGDLEQLLIENKANVDLKDKRGEV